MSAYMLKGLYAVVPLKIHKQKCNHALWIVSTALMGIAIHCCGTQTDLKQKKVFVCVIFTERSKQLQYKA